MYTKTNPSIQIHNHTHTHIHTHTKQKYKHTHTQTAAYGQAGKSCDEKDKGAFHLLV